jgi:hypothetical protein
MFWPYGHDLVETWSDWIARGRVLAKHQEYEERWALQAVQLAAKYGKQPEDVALSRGFKFRKRREKLDHLHKSKPIHERLPGHLFWQVCLRNAYARSATAR